ncbi:MAG: hypothetical protein K6F92_08485 [Lachnospiraceae bacterium]|nr:hypothetical protein [Lachnospiraceae bacterium]
MKKRINNYKSYIDRIIEANSPDTDYQSVIKEHLIQLEFFMHERLIHLIVTVLFALMEVIVLGLVLTQESIFIALLFLLILVLLVPYVMHYYLLENSVQYMYEQYDRLLELSGTRAFKNE